jgi:hypothetical protein
MPLDTISAIVETLETVTDAGEALNMAGDETKNRAGTWLGMRWWGWLLLILVFIPVALLMIVGAVLGW